MRSIFIKFKKCHYSILCLFCLSLVHSHEHNVSSTTVTRHTASTFAAGFNMVKSASPFMIYNNPSFSIKGFSCRMLSHANHLMGAKTKIISPFTTNNQRHLKQNGFPFTKMAANPEMEVKGNFTSIADGSMVPLATNLTDFGSVSIGSGTVTVTYTIQNTGLANLTLGAITFSGIHASDFTLITSPSVTVAPGGTTTFQVGFNPLLKGIKTAMISIVSNDPDENPYNFALTGLGVQTYADTDGDSITDNFDIDDDNDGILDITEQTTCLVSPFSSSVPYTFLNETFGTGITRGLININIPGASCTYCYEDGITGTNTVACPKQSDFSVNDGEYTVNYMISDPLGGPTNLATWSATNWTAQLDHTPADTNGRMAIFNADYTPGTFYETTITGVIPNVPITYSFWALNIMSQSAYAGSILPNITVEFRDLSNVLISTYNTGDVGRCSAVASDNTCALSQWQQFITSVNLGNITDFVVRFKNNAPGGGGNDLALDDILIIQNYCDSDGDGVANLFDLDDENDGIPDIEEAGFKTYSNGLATMDTSIWLDTNNNGLYDSLDALISGGSYAPYDTDGDTVPNYLDLDSDNDSYFDVDEAGLFNGDGDINGDGVGDELDADGDGVLDLYDTKVGFGTLARAYAQDTDSMTNPDYMQVDADNNGINDILIGLYASLDANNDGVIDGTSDNDKDGILDAFDTNSNAIGSPRDLNRKLFLEFDGRNDYGQGTNVLGGLDSASIMAWVDLNDAFATDGVVIGQDAFQLRINSDRKLEAIVNATTLTFNDTVLNTTQWYHVGAVYGNGFLKLYLNGSLVATTAASGIIAADASSLTIGKNPSALSNYFKGKIDEVRVFDVALTDIQLQRMVYQEIENTSSQVRGSIIPKDIGALPFANVLRYYRMDVYKDDIIDDLTTGSIDTGSGMKIYNNKYIAVQQAPMPFITERDGNFAAAVDSPTNEIRGLDITEQDWSIVQVRNNITETANNTDLGMLVDTDAVITMNNDTKIQNDWYLKLDGKIDLQGKSQLVQTTESDLDATSFGFIERDQKGQANIFNYNYWSSPVGTINNTTNNNSYTVDGVLRDGTNPQSIQPITWTTGYDGAPTVPITLSTYWFFKFQNVTPLYANWGYVGPTGILEAAQGFTMKGSGAEGLTQNYTFVGKPNSGTISSPIAADHANLSGNPYASAIDADVFITDNLSATTGAIYFWEHYNTNPSHILLEYQGGYAARTLVGGTPPVAPAGISGLGSSSRIPGRFIPVGQGFLLYGNSTGGSIVFNNNQRTFIKENHVDSNVLFRTNTVTSAVGLQSSNREDAVVENTFTKLRLGFLSSNDFHRQLLLGFMNENATSGFDMGYDARQIDCQPNEMYFINGSEKLVIQGDGFFNAARVFPIGVKTAAEGVIKIALDEVAQFDQNQPVYLHDAVTQVYHNIKEAPFEINLPAGIFDNRFSLRFATEAALGIHEETSNNQITADYTHSNAMLNIKNNTLNTKIESVSLYTILGQLIRTTDLQNSNQSFVQIPIHNISSEVYLVKVHTSNGDIFKKIVIK